MALGSLLSVFVWCFILSINVNVNQRYSPFVIVPECVKSAHPSTFTGTVAGIPPTEVPVDRAPHYIQSPAPHLDHIQPFLWSGQQTSTSENFRKTLPSVNKRLLRSLVGSVLRYMSTCVWHLLGGCIHLVNSVIKSAGKKHKNINH